MTVGLACLSAGRQASKKRLKDACSIVWLAGVGGWKVSVRRRHNILQSLNGRLAKWGEERNKDDPTMSCCSMHQGYSKQTLSDKGTDQSQKKEDVRRGDKEDMSAK
jgi:hypothetical protein